MLHVTYHIQVYDSTCIIYIGHLRLVGFECVRCVTGEGTHPGGGGSGGGGGGGAVLTDYECPLWLRPSLSSGT